MIAGLKIKRFPFSKKYWSCKRKTRYASEEAAFKIINRKKASNLHCYRCRFCEGWHIAHERPLQKMVLAVTKGRMLEP